VDDGEQTRWLASFAWRPLKGVPKLCRLRMLKDGLGCWEEVLSAFIMRWAQPRRLMKNAQVMMTSPH
jgi:hypothetical protein